MAVSTEVLNEDIRGLKADLHRVDVGLAELRQEVKDAIGLARWAGTLLAATLLTSGVGAVIWGATLTARVHGMEARTGEKFVERGAGRDGLESKIDARFDRLEASIARAIEQARPAAAAAPKPGP